jgi:hypothetical protein
MLLLKRARKRVDYSKNFSHEKNFSAIFIEPKQDKKK